jgi:hypothetical protein
MSSRIVLGFGVLLLCFPQPAAAVVWTVHPDGTGDAATIQAAIDSVALIGDIIELADGVYTGPGNRDLISYEKMFVVRSQSGDPSTCIIDLGGDPADHHWGFTFSGDG